MSPIQQTWVCAKIGGQYNHSSPLDLSPEKLCFFSSLELPVFTSFIRNAFLAVAIEQSSCSN